MLLKVKWLNYVAAPNYAPTQEDCVINLDDVVSAVPTEAPRGAGPFLFVRFRDGSTMTIVGTPGDLVAADLQRSRR